MTHQEAVVEPTIHCPIRVVAEGEVTRAGYLEALTTARPPPPRRDRFSELIIEHIEDQIPNAQTIIIRALIDQPTSLTAVRAARPQPASRPAAPTARWCLCVVGASVLAWSMESLAM